MIIDFETEKARLNRGTSKTIRRQTNDAKSTPQNNGEYSDIMKQMLKDYKELVWRSEQLYGDK